MSAHFMPQLYYRFFAHLDTNGDCSAVEADVSTKQSLLTALLYVTDVLLNGQSPPTLTPTDALLL